MRTVNMSQAKTHLSRLVEETAGGEEIVIAKHNRPVACLVALEASTRRRKPGGWEDQVWMADDFDAPLPEELERSIYGDASEPPAS
ncbi:MAG: type II toxin-antitoxin system prevent-host-death family antitoxin [Rhodospirillales bacterium]|nr:type II toxin-antitoxin system prevent-host-death family antitoxin [Rhodospirillales bacterium]